MLDCPRPFHSSDSLPGFEYKPDSNSLDPATIWFGGQRRFVSTQLQAQEHKSWNRLPSTCRGVCNEQEMMAFDALVSALESLKATTKLIFTSGGNKIFLQ